MSNTAKVHSLIRDLSEECAAVVRYASACAAADADINVRRKRYMDATDGLASIRRTVDRLEDALRDARGDAVALGELADIPSPVTWPEMQKMMGGGAGA